MSQSLKIGLRHSVESGVFLDSRLRGNDSIILLLVYFFVYQ